MESPIRRMRKKLSMTQPELALSLNISQGSVSKVENGLAQIPQRAIESLQEIYVDSDRVVELQKKFVNGKEAELRGRIRRSSYSK
jgi:transcriptional regulator with XRE-family HTH domain